MPRWHVSFNITALRLISFSIDHHWAVIASRSNAAADMELNQVRAAPRVLRRHSFLTSPTPLAPQSHFASPSSSHSSAPTERQRAATPHHLAAYESPLNYLAYTLYSPLYIAGPIVTFNNFYSQVQLLLPFKLSASLRRLLADIPPDRLSTRPRSPGGRSCRTPSGSGSRSSRWRSSSTGSTSSPSRTRARRPTSARASSSPSASGTSSSSGSRSAPPSLPSICAVVFGGG